jgi:putative MATE family efflux protein
MGRLKRFFGPQDMTQGNIWNSLIVFSVPLLIGNFAQQMYNTVDSIVVSNYAAHGDNALAAVGVCNPVINLLLVLFMGISTGAGIMVSQFFGAKQKKMLSNTVGNCLLLTFFSSILMMVVGVLGAPYIMSMLNTPAAIYDGAVQYLQITFLGILGVAFYNIISGILRGMGDSLYPLLFLLVACVLNIILDIVFVKEFHMDVAGVAWATIIAQAVSAVLCVLRLMRMKDTVEINRSTLRWNKDLVMQITKLGLPAGLTQAIFSVAMLTVQSLTNTLGEAVVTMTTVVMRVDGFAMMPNFTFGMAATTFAGQNIGARRLDRVEQGTNAALKLALGVATLLTLCLLFFGEGLMRMFTSTEMIISMGVRSMRIIAVGYICFAASQVLSGVMRGAGETMSPMWISIVTTFVLRLPIAYLWAHFSRSPQWPNGSPDCLYVSLLISWTLGAALTFLVFKKGSWRKKMLLTMQDSADASA